jgi:hypothetical protein
MSEREIPLDPGQRAAKSGDSVREGMPIALTEE